MLFKKRITLVERTALLTLIYNIKTLVLITGEILKVFQIWV